MKKHNCKLYPLAVLAALALVPHKTYAQDSVWDADKWEVSVGGGAALVHACCRFASMQALSN